MSHGRFQRVLLVGFMGAGKTTVGRLLAERLGWRFLDFDDAVEEEAGVTIAELFRTRGEAAFRALEVAVAERLLSVDGAVLGSGGGWPAEPGRLEGVPDGTATVWLKVSAEEAVRRASGGPSERPLLAGPAPVERARDLLADRARFYGRALWTVDTEGRPPIDVCEEIAALVLAPQGVRAT